jgi:hypothetical protein
LNPSIPPFFQWNKFLKEYEELAKILKKDVGKIKEVHLDYLAALIKSMRTVKKDSEDARAEFLEKRITKNKSGTKGAAEFILNKKMTKEELDFMIIESARMGDRSSCARNHSSVMYWFFIRKLVYIFPKNADVVQKYLFSTGCSKEECRVVLEDKIGRSKTTEHFFRGLPPSSKKLKSSTSKK